MQHSLDLLATLTLLGAAQGILLSLSLLGLKQGNRLATRLLAALMATISISLTGSVLLSTKYILIHPYLTQVTSPFAFLGGPLLYLYVKASTARRIELRRKHLWHFVPFGLCVAYYLPLYLQTKEEKLNYLTAAFQNYPPTEWRVRSVLLLIQAFIYFILAVLIFVKHSREVNDQDSSAHKINLLWLRTFLVMIFVICGIGGFRVFFNFR